MSTKKITRAQALEVAIAAVEDAQVGAVLHDMLVQLTKPRKKPEGPTKAQLANIELAKTAAAAIAEHGAPVSAKWVVEHVEGIDSTQKASAVMKSAIAQGLVERQQDRRIVFYKAL